MNTEIIFLGNMTKNKNLTRAKKAIIYGCVFLVISLFTRSCNNSADCENESILHAENLIWTRPDSTIAILEGLDTVFLTENDKMMCFLLHEHALMRLTQQPAPDSIIDRVIAHFDHRGANRYLCQALYVKGTSHYLTMDYFAAMQCLKEAEYLIPALEPSEPYAGMIYFISGHISETDNLYSVACNYYRKALACFKLTDDHIHVCTCYRDIARMMKVSTDDTTFIQYFDSAAIVALKTNNRIYYLETELQKELNLQVRDSAKVGELCKLMCDSFHYNQYALPVVEWYMQQDDYEQAGLYLQKMAPDTAHTNWSKENYYYLYSQYLAHFGHAEEAYALLQKVYDDLYKHLISDAKVRTYAIARRYDLEREQQKTLRLTIARQRLWIIVGAVVLILLVVTAAAAWVIQRQHRVSERLAQEKALARAQQERAEAQAQAAQERQKAQAAKMKMLKRKAREQKKLLCQSLHDRIQLIGNLKKKLEQHPQASSDWLGIVIDSNLPDSPKGWTAFSNEFKKIYGKKPEMLRKEYPRLTDEDVRYLSLSLIGLDTEDIGNLLHLQSRTLWNRKQKVKFRLNGVDDLDAWSEKWQEDNYILSPDEDDA